VTGLSCSRRVVDTLDAKKVSAEPIRDPLRVQVRETA
jgi:hypothetical protein